MNLYVFLLLGSISTAAAPPGQSAHHYIEQTGSEIFVQRQQASAALEAMGPSIYMAVNKAALTHKDAEVRKRCRDVAAKLRRERINQFGEMPYIDSLWYDPGKGFQSAFVTLPGTLSKRLTTAAPKLDYNRAVRYLDRVGRDSRPYTNYRMAMELLVGDLLEEGVNDRLIQEVVTELVKRDRAYLRHYGYFGNGPGG